MDGDASRLSSGRDSSLDFGSGREECVGGDGYRNGAPATGGLILCCRVSWVDARRFQPSEARAHGSRWFPRAVSDLEEPKADEILATKNTPSRLGSDGHEECPAAGSPVVFRSPTRQLQTVASRAARVDEIRRIPNLPGESLIAITAAEREQAQKLAELLKQPLRRGGADVCGSTVRT